MCVNHFRSISFVLALFLFFVGCKKKDVDKPKPIAGFSFTLKNPGSLPDTVIFSNTSTNASSYLWSFDDGTTSTIVTPNNIFKVARIYKVKLVVKGDGGTDSIQLPVEILLDKPKADFSFNVENSGTFPTNVTFATTLKNIDMYAWNFGDGQISAQPNPSHAFTKGGVYSVKLVVSNAGGKDSITKNVSVSPVNNFSVRVFLITPIDKPFNQAYYDILKATAVNIQNWYKTQMNGSTFQLNDPVVDTIRGLHTYNWYNSDNGAAISGTDPRFYGYYNTNYEISKLMAVNTNLYTYMFYVAAPGGGAGATGTSALGDQDLNGLLEEKNNPVKRWIGGSAHEWGHAFGLPHPDNQSAQALMWTGYTIYPNCVLQQVDKDILIKSKFFK